MLVRTIKIKFGDNAGKIWNALNEKGTLEKRELLGAAKINDKDFHIGLGWLAREDKIFKENDGYYRLGNTNLDREIGAVAGTLWKIMDIWGEADISTMRRLAGTDEKEIYSALGWLAREDKICENGEQIYSLK